MLEKGLIQVYTGDPGKFNFAPIGLSFRAAGQNLKTMITCFQVHELMDGAAMTSTLLKSNLVIDHLASQDRARADANVKANEIRLAYGRAREAIFSGGFDMVVLNDIHGFVNQGIIPLKDVLTLMSKKPSNVELVLTGSGASDEILERADLVTYMVVHSQIVRPETDGTLRERGYVEVITGDGKGKTTYCLGKAVLASSLGVRSAMIQFIKSAQPYGEVKALEKFPMIKIMSLGEGFLDDESVIPRKKHLDAAHKAWETCLREIFSLKYGLMVLDEINTATFFGLINPERVREMCSLKPQNLDLLLSGRNAHADVIAFASTVIEMKEIKHPFTKGIRARKGIEY